MSDARSETTTSQTTTTQTTGAAQPVTRVVEVEEGAVDTRNTPVVEEGDLDLSHARTVGDGVGDHEAEPAPRKRRGWGWLALLLILLLIGGGLIFADRYTKDWAEKKAATQLQEKLGTPDKPKITIKDTPFLTSAAASKFNNVTLGADKLNTKVPIEHLDANIHGLKMSNNYQNAVADKMDGKARVTWQTIAKQAGYDLKYTGDNKVSVNYNVEFFGQKLNAIVVGTPKLDAAKQVVNFENPGVNVAGITLPPDVTKQIMNTFVKPIAIPLPEGVKATNMTMADDGITLEFNGENVDLNKLG